MTIHKKINILIIAAILAAGLIAVLTVTLTLRREGLQEIEEYRAFLIRERKQSLDNLIDTSLVVIEKNYQDTNDIERLTGIYEKKLQDLIQVAYQIVEFAANITGVSKEERQQLAMAAIKNIRYGSNGYVWINDLKPTMIMHPFKPQLDDTDLTEFKDSNGKHLFVEMVKAVQKTGEGSVSYIWPKPGQEDPVLKISYLKLYKPWGWILGTGVYVDVAEQEMKEKTKSIINTFRYGKNKQEYFYILNSKSKTMEQHPKTSLIGLSIDDPKFTDPAGTRLLVEQVDGTLEQGKSFYTYLWPKLGEDKPVPKLTVTRYFEPWDWIVATGVYTDDIDKAVLHKQQSIAQATKKQVTQIALSIVALLIVTIFFTRYIVDKKIAQPLRNTVDILRDIAEGEGDLTRKLTIITRDETAEVAHWFNRFVTHLAVLLLLKRMPRFWPGCPAV